MGGTAMNEEPLITGGRRLDEAQPQFDTFDSYLAGQLPLKFVAPEIEQATKGRLKTLSINYARTVVAALEERLEVRGFRVGETIEPSLWDIWQRNSMDEQSANAHQDALTYGRSYLLTWIGPDGQPRITAESPRQVWVEHAPGSRQRMWAIKRYVGSDGHGYASILHPTYIEQFRSPEQITLPEDPMNPNQQPMFSASSSGWMKVNEVPNPLGVVPVIPIINKPRMLTAVGESELADLLPLLDAINKIASDMMVAAEFTAMPRRWVTGLSPLPEKKNDQGNPTGEIDTEAFDPLAGRLWLAEGTETRFGEFGGSDLGSFTNALDKLVLTLASLASLPIHMVGITTANPASADALRASEASLAVKARKRQQSFSDAYEEAIRLAVAIRDGWFDPRLDRLQTVWKDAETRTLAQQADAALKLVSSGLVPIEQALEDLGYTPTQIERMREMRTRELTTKGQNQ